MARLNGVGILHSKDVQISPYQILRVQKKISSGEIYIDIRKWAKFVGSDDYIPSRKGIMLRPDQWISLIKNIDDLLHE